MHSNNTQVQVQIPAAYYSLGPVAMNGGLGVSGHDQNSSSDSDNNSHSSTTSLHPYHPGNNPLYHHSAQHSHVHSTQQSAYHGQQQQQSYASSQHTSNNNGSHNGYHADLQKTIPIQHQVDIYQPPHQSLDQDMMNPIINRQLNNQHASNYHAPYNYHNYNSQHGYHYNSQSRQQQSPSSPQQQQQQQQLEQQSEQQSDQQQQQGQRSNASTPTPTVASTLSTVSSASTPSLTSNGSTMQSSQDYGHNHSNSNNNRPTSPTSTATPAGSSFHIPASPDQLASSMTPAMSSWTASNASSMEQELRGNSSPKNDRSSYYPQTYSQQEQQPQAWVASMSATDEFHASSEFINHDRQQHQHHQRAYSQPSRNSYHSQPSVASQQPSLPAMGGLPLLSPSNMMQSNYQPTSYSMSMHEAPTIMSHMDHGRVASSMAPPSRYGPVRSNYTKSRTQSMGSQRDFNGIRTRTNSINSTTSSVASTGVLTSIATTLGSTSIAGVPVDADLSSALEEEESDSHMTVQMRRTNTAPRKAVAARVFECSVPGCAKAYTQLHNLKSHERTGHTPVIKPKPFHCIVEGCTKAFSQRKSLVIHIKTAHIEFKFKPFKCMQNGCTKAYTQLHNLRTHEKTVHLVDLSRKRVKNTNNGSSINGGNAVMGYSQDQGQMHYQPHHHPSNSHSGLGLSYDGLDELADFPVGASMPGGDEHSYYTRHHQQHQQQQQQQQYHHHQQPAYARLPHLNALPSMHDRV
ncbi:hypothetical protein BGZ50_007646 [Haplosporangium sp. Z 11]|nr:hypothetical protein BGZ50_007646 [Haplosporangium sp. Z 11]